jgi:hypothetical protein
MQSTSALISGLRNNQMLPFAKKIKTVKADPYAEMKATISGAIDVALKNNVSAAQIMNFIEGFLPSNGSHSRLSMMALAQKDERNRALPADLAAKVAHANEVRERRKLQAEEQERREYRENVERRARNEEWTR